MSVHNGTRYLPAAMDSVLRQTWRDFEFLIVDDGSTDGAGEMLAAYAARDPRVVVHSTPNRGLTRSLNMAARLARGSLLARMDADDVALPERLAKQVAWLAEHPDVVVLGTRALRVDPELWPICDWNVPLEHEAIDHFHLSGLSGGIIHPAAMIRRDAFAACGGYDESLPASQDYDLWLRLAEHGRLANLPDILLLYRLHLDSVTSARRAQQLECLKRSCLLARKRRGLDDKPAQLHLNRGALSPLQQRLTWVRRACKAGYFAAARKHVLAALREAPAAPRVWLHLAGAFALSLVRPDHMPSARSIVAAALDSPGSVTIASP